MRADEVRPKKWSETTVLFDDGNYSVVAGMYDRPALGERWNGETDADLGFPNVSGHPVWHVAPEFLEVPLLQGLLDELARHPQGRDRTDAILLALHQRVQPTAQRATTP